jgi:hypothetical protein
LQATKIGEELPLVELFRRELLARNLECLLKLVLRFVGFLAASVDLLVKGVHGSRSSLLRAERRLACDAAAALACRLA